MYVQFTFCSIHKNNKYKIDHNNKIKINHYHDINILNSSIQMIVFKKWFSFLFASQYLT